MIAIGSPFGFENSVSAGVVSGVHRALPGGQMTPFIQTDVAVNPGNSGGPLLNSAGQVVGVNSQIYSRSGGYMGLSFAIPADVAARVADQLRTTGKVAHGRIGVGIQPIDQSLAQSFGLPDANGALVGTVEKDGPAAKAGFKSGDIIRKIDDVAVTDSTDVTSRIGNMAPGTKTQIEVWRDGKPVTLTAQIATLDDEKVAKASTPSEGQGKLGARDARADAAGEGGGRHRRRRGRERHRAGGARRRAAGRRDRRRRHHEGEERRGAAPARREVGQDRCAARAARRPADLRADSHRLIEPVGPAGDSCRTSQQHAGRDAAAGECPAAVSFRARAPAALDCARRAARSSDARSHPPPFAAAT